MPNRGWNRSAPTPARGVTVSISTEAAADPRRCLAALNAAVQACRLPLAQPAPKILCVGLQGDGITFEVRFVVATTPDVAAARTEMLALAHRHLRHAGISLGIAGIAPPPSLPAPTCSELLAESDLFGPLADTERALFARHLVTVTREPGETLIHQGAVPKALFLLVSGTVELTQGDGDSKRVLLRPSPGDSIGMIGLITGSPSPTTATALTSVTAYSLNEAAIGTVLKTCPAWQPAWRRRPSEGRRGYAAKPRRMTKTISRSPTCCTPAFGSSSAGSMSDRMRNGKSPNHRRPARQSIPDPT